MIKNTLIRIMMNIKEEVITDDSIDEKDQYLIQALNDDRTNGDASNSHLFGKKSEMEGIREVQQLLKKWQLQDLCNDFSDHRIDNFALQRLIESDIRDLIPCVGLRVKFRFALQKYILNIGKFPSSQQESSRKSSSSEEEEQLVLHEHHNEIVESDSEMVNEVPTKIPRLSSPTGDNYSYILQNITEERETLAQFICEECNEEFKNKLDMRQHLRIHYEYLYFCTECDRCFTTKYNLLTHQRKHRDERPFPCDLCYKRFTCAAYLNKHKKAHLRGTIFICEKCHSTFRSAEYLGYHKETHLRDDISYVLPEQYNN